MNVDPKKLPRLPIHGEILDIVQDGVVIQSACIVTGIEAWSDPVIGIRTCSRCRCGCDRGTPLALLKSRKRSCGNGNDSVVELKKLRRNTHLRIMGTMVLRGVK
jgi:hypothetical protein